MNLLKKLWNFLFGKKEEESNEESDRDLVGTGSDLGLDKEEPTVQHCGSHLRFKKSCLDCLKAVAAI